MPRKRRGHGWNKKRKKKPKKKEAETWQDYLQRIYFDPAHPASFKGAQKLYQVVKEEGRHDVRLSQI